MFLKKASSKKVQHQSRRQYTTNGQIIEKIGFAGMAIVRQSEHAQIETFGKWSRSATPGLTFYIPFAQKVKAINMREFAIPISPQESVTHDNVQVKTSGSVYFRVRDTMKACYNTYDLLDSVMTHAQSSMRTAIGSVPLDTLFHNRAILNNQILESMREAATRWGVEIMRYEIKNVTTDARVAEAMDAQSIAERKKRETALNAEAQKHRDITVSQGKREAVINEATANYEREVKEAEANKQAVLLATEAHVTSIKTIGAALREHPEAGNYLLAEKYLKNMSELLPKSTVFLPKDIGDVPKLVATAKAIAVSLNEEDAELSKMLGK